MPKNISFRQRENFPVFLAFCDVQDLEEIQMKYLKIISNTLPIWLWRASFLKPQFATSWWRKAVSFEIFDKIMYIPSLPYLISLAFFLSAWNTCYKMKLITMTLTFLPIKGYKPWIPIYLTVDWMNKSPKSCSGDPSFEQILDKHAMRHQWFIHHVKGVDGTISHAALVEEVLRQFLYEVGNNLVASQFWNHSNVKLNPSHYCLQAKLKEKRKQLLSELRRWACNYAWSVVCH